MYARRPPARRDQYLQMLDELPDEVRKPDAGPVEPDECAFAFLVDPGQVAQGNRTPTLSQNRT